MNEQDEVRLRHMLDAAREALAFAEGHTREDLGTNQMLVRALSKMRILKYPGRRLSA